jgi:uncharacterized Zn finger protein (UPF0148 family)
MDGTFRIKRSKETDSKPKICETVSGTLDSIHQNLVSEIRNTDINQLKTRKTEIEEELESIEDVRKFTSLKNELRTIEKTLTPKDPIGEYYLQNADIMLQYYGNSTNNQAVTTTPTDQNTFVKYLTHSVSDLQAVSKKDLLEEFAMRMKINMDMDYSEKTCVTEHCNVCNVAREELSEDGMLVCPKCGSQEYMLVVSDYPSFRDPPKERNNYAYKKINHLNEILNQFQAKESTIIPDEVMHEVICEIKKRRIQNIAELNEIGMREILKKLNKSKYYEHAAHILSRLNGNPPPTITPEIEEKIRAMFQEIQAPFLLYCPDDRTNFLSYSYILYKFFELLELDEYKMYFPLLKSRDRLISHDLIWKKICDYLKWEFIRSV